MYIECTCSPHVCKLKLHVCQQHSLSKIQSIYIAFNFPAESCPTDVTHESRGTYTWNKVPHGIVIQIECSRSPRKHARRECVLSEDGTAVWLEPDTSACDLVIALKNDTATVEFFIAGFTFTNTFVVV